MKNYKVMVSADPRSLQPEQRDSIAYDVIVSVDDDATPIDVRRAAFDCLHPGQPYEPACVGAPQKLDSGRTMIRGVVCVPYEKLKPRHAALLRSAEQAQRRLLLLGQALGELTPGSLVAVLNDLEEQLRASGGHVTRLADVLPPSTELDALS